MVDQGKALISALINLEIKEGTPFFYPAILTFEIYRSSNIPTYIFAIPYFYPFRPVIILSFQLLKAILQTLPCTIS